MMPLSMEIKPSNLAVRFFAVAVVYFAIAATLGLLISTGTASRIFPATVSIAYVHAVTLGWFSITIMGAMYQLVPTLLGKKIYSQKLANIQFWLINIGVAGIFISLIFGANKPFIFFAFITTSASYLFAFIIYMTMKGNKLELTLRFFTVSIIYFFGTVTLGVFIATGKAFFIFPGNVKSAHFHLGLLGWVSMTIMGAMYQMFPMISLRELHSKKIGSISFWLMAIGVLGFLFGFLFRLTEVIVLSGGMVTLAVYLFIYNLFKTLRKEVKFKDQKMDLSVKFFISAIIYFLFAISLGMLLPFKSLPSSVIVSQNQITFLGWISMTIMGAMYHLVPMLVWMSKYAGKIGEESIPTIKDLYSERLANLVFYSINIGILGVVFSLIVNIKSIELIFQVIITLGVYLFAYSILSILKR